MIQSSKTLTATTFLFAFSLIPPALAADGHWKYSTGFDYSTGDYGGDPIDTNISYLPLTASYQQNLWSFKATIPWVQIEGGGTVIGAGEGGVTTDDSSNQKTTESGLGDIWVTASYSVPAVPSEVGFLDLSAKLKLPTADEEKGLGTGEIDYTLQADVFKPMGGYTPFATLAYKVKGDSDSVDLDNAFFVSLGSDYRLSASRSVGAAIDFQEASSASGDDSLELFAYASQKLDSQWSLTLYGYKGLKDGSPDLGGGLQISYKP